MSDNTLTEKLVKRYNTTISPPFLNWHENGQQNKGFKKRMEKNNYLIQ